ncbi:MAG TPA: serine/threonine-protein kinase, partial [Nannocystaceae bacterium]|nr:serine/threonine-protein kinase [Nannocystaceae bacterium]
MISCESEGNALPQTRTTTKLEAAFDDDAALAAGTVVAGRYRVLDALGSGAMGTVYLAEHLAIGRRVALKVVAAGWSKSTAVTRRFRAEARAASAIGHPNIVEVLDADELPDGRPFIVMELLDGRDLLALLRREGPLPWVRVCQLGARIAHALHAAHEIGIVHRDLKAENVMLISGPNGEVVKVLDFGIAVTITEGAERATRP